MKTFVVPLLLGGALLTSLAVAGVSLTAENKDGTTVFRMDNGRIALVIEPDKGGAVLSYKDRLGGDVELVPDKEPRGLCLDHFQSQYWPGELYKGKYEVTGQKNDPKEVELALRYLVTGRWSSGDDERIRDLVLEKTYRLRADSPALECRIRITAPRKDAKLFAYWQQHLFYAGGQYDRTDDRTFRPTTRGVRIKGGDNWGQTGMEDFLRDGSAGWMALIDTKRKSGLVILSDYNEIDALYCSGGNVTVEPMYRITYLPAGEVVEYVSFIVPVVGLDNVVSATPDYIAGYRMKSDGKGAGTIALAVGRSVNPPAPLEMKIGVMNARKPTQVAPVGTAVFDTYDGQVQTRELAFRDAGDDPLVLKAETTLKPASAPAVTGAFEDYHNGIYQWGENLQTDMVTPVYRGVRPPQKLSLRKPNPLKLQNEPGIQVWYAEGWLDDFYGMATALQMTHLNRDGNNKDQHDRVFTSHSGNWLTRLSAFPYDYGKLLSYDIIILGGLKQESLGNIGQEMLCDFLGAGGGMIVLGGPMAYGASRLQGTPLAERFPVALASTPFDLEKLPPGTVKPAATTAPFLENLDWSALPRVLYIHKVEVKPWGRVVLEAEGRPFLVIGEYGPQKARIACILGAPMGTFAKAETPFWEWQDWKYLLRQLNWWVLKEDQRFDPKW